MHLAVRDSGERLSWALRLLSEQSDFSLQAGARGLPGVSQVMGQKPMF